MPNVLLYTRPTINGRRKYVPADPKLKNNQGTFFLRYKVDGKDVWETTNTKTYTFALAAAKQKESELILRESKATPEVPKPKARLTLDDQRDKFLEQKDLTKKPDGTRLDKETLSAYRQETAGFLAVAKKTYADEIDGMDLRRYMAALDARGDSHRTPGALAALAEAESNPVLWILRHAAGDWGQLDAHDMQANAEALRHGSRILSSYILPTGVKIWIITEATDDEGNREATTILLPEEY